MLLELPLPCKISLKERDEISILKTKSDNTTFVTEQSVNPRSLTSIKTINYELLTFEELDIVRTFVLYTKGLKKITFDSKTYLISKMEITYKQGTGTITLTCKTI